MPHEMDEEGKENLPTSSSFSILTWWRKFHFSGRVIACSVLLGLGLILIGGLIFAINITDDKKPNEKDDATGPITTKAPSNYTGPIVMGIGGFIVITGVIMCLFETQVCRKKTGDSSPLISDKADDPERNGSDPAAQPSTSQGHKSRKHGAHKTCTSPKKSKCRHGKSRSKERHHQKNPSPKSPSLPIQTPKSFTSSEDNFLTPPNTLQENVAEVQKGDSVNSDGKNSGLMKSFTSSDPSWNQSTEFMTPSTSFRDTSLSLNNSVEIDEKYDDKRKNSTELTEKQISSEYMTPLTVEEDRIQQLLIRVKKEQKQMADAKKETNVGTSEHSSQEKECNSSEVQKEIEKDKEDEEKIKKKDNSSNISHPEIESDLKDVSQVPSIQTEEAASDESRKNNYEVNVSEKNLSTVHNEALGEISDNANSVKEIISSQADSTSLTDETPALKADKAVSNSNVQENNEQADLDSSVSSDETVISPDNFQENDNNGSSNENSTISTLKEIAEDESKCHSNDSESSDHKPTVETDINHHNNQGECPQRDVSDVHDPSPSKSGDLKVEVYGTENESKDNVS